VANVAEYLGIEVPRTWWKLVLTAVGRRFEVIRAEVEPSVSPALVFFHGVVVIVARRGGRVATLQNPEDGSIGYVTRNSF
jgi:hypothetical protein